MTAAGVALSLLVACGSSGGKGGAAPGSTSSTTVVACTAAAASGVPDAGRSALATATGDFDGDGRPDRLLTYRGGDGGPWHVRVELGAGGSDDLTLAGSPEGVRALGGVHLDVGPGEAALAVVGTGAAGVTVGLFVVQQCRLARVSLNGAPAEFAVRSSAAGRDGLVCQPPGLVAYSATTSDGQTYRGTSVAYLLLGAALDETHRATQTLLPGDPDLARYGAFACGTVKLG